MKCKLNIYEKIFLILSVLNTAVICLAGVNYLTYGILAYLMVLRITKNITNDSFLLLSLFVPNKYLQIVAMIMYILFTPSHRQKKINNSELLFLFYIASMGFINCIYYEAMPLGTIFQVIVYYSILKIIALYGGDNDYFKFMLIMDRMLYVQVIACLLEILKYRSMGDHVTGTLISAHYLGVYLMIYIILLFCMRPAWIKKSEMLLKVFVAAMFIYLSDAKHVWVVFAFAFFVSWVLNKLHIKKKIIFSVIAMTVIVISGTLLLASPFGQSFIAHMHLSQKVYVLNEQYNKKYIFFKRTFEEMCGLNGIFGFGVGQYGSQISITLSKGIIYWWDPNLSSFHFAIAPYAKAVEGLMTEWYTKSGIAISSMVLGFPLVSFPALLAELGVIGYTWLLGIFDRRFKNDNPTFIIAFFILTIFDTYFEIPCVFILVLIATYANSYSKKKTIDHLETNSLLRKEEVK